LPSIRFHDLRHFAATLMLSEGVHPKIASARLGHSTITITLDLYSHAAAGLDVDAADRMQRALRQYNNCAVVPPVVPAGG
jgi:integrase